MTAPLTPELALAYLTTLSADLRAAVILRDGQLLAGPVRLREPAAQLFQDEEATTLEGRTGQGAVFAARDDEHAIVAVTGPHALPRLTRRDLRTVLSALGREIPAETPPTTIRDAAVNALLRAVSAP